MNRNNNGKMENKYINSELLANAFYNVGKTIGDIANSVIDMFIDAWEKIKPILNACNYKLSKKKFRKMLQAFGIQRNLINNILKNNKKKYNYFFLISILNDYM